MGHLADHVRPGDEHIGAVLHHHGEIGDRRRIDRASGAGAHDRRDLGHHPGGQGVPEEDVGIPGQGDHPFLDPRAAGIVQAENRRADLHRHVHQLADLLGEGFGKGAAEHGEIVGEHEHRPAVDPPVAGHHAIAGDLLPVHAEIRASPPPIRASAYRFRRSSSRFASMVRFPQEDIFFQSAMNFSRPMSVRGWWISFITTL